MIDPTQAHNPESPTITSVRDGDITLNVAPAAAPAGYELESLIGEGGMGAVYRARELAMGRDVAVKILQSRYSPDSAISKRFLEEARITGQLQHPGIPPVHQVGTLPGGRPFLAMKLIKGDTLDELLKKRKRFATEAFAADANLYLQFNKVPQAAGWAMKAAAGKGVDAGSLSEVERSQLRKKAFEWIRQSMTRLDKGFRLSLSDQIWNDPNFIPVREPEALAKLPPQERAEWTKLWAELPKKLEVAPAPRPLKP
jgi:hypothetical protein